MDEEIDGTDTKWTQIKVNKIITNQFPKKSRRDNVYMATNDIIQCKMICRVAVAHHETRITNAKIATLNIRKLMMNTAPTLLSNYNIGLGGQSGRREVALPSKRNKHANIAKE